MKIKLFEEYSVGYVSISEEEYDDYCLSTNTLSWYRTHLTLFNEEDINLANKYFDFKLISGKITIADNGVRNYKIIPIDTGYLYYLYTSANKDTFISFVFKVTVHKFQDEWYYVRVLNSVNNSMVYTFYKCDQLYGLEELLSWLKDSVIAFDPQFKRLNEGYHGEYYQEISSAEEMSIRNRLSSEQFTDKEMSLLKNVNLPTMGNVNLYCVINDEKTTVVISYNKLLGIVMKPNHRRHLFGVYKFKINKYSDEWFVISVIYKEPESEKSFKPPYKSPAFVNHWYKCDQIDGVVHCIEDYYVN